MTLRREQVPCHANCITSTSYECITMLSHHIACCRFEHLVLFRRSEALRSTSPACFARRPCTRNVGTVSWVQKEDCVRRQIRPQINLWRCESRTDGRPLADHRVHLGGRGGMGLKRLTTSGRAGSWTPDFCPPVSIVFSSATPVAMLLGCIKRVGLWRRLIGVGIRTASAGAGRISTPKATYDRFGRFGDLVGSLLPLRPLLTLCVLAYLASIKPLKLRTAAKEVAADRAAEPG